MESKDRIAKVIARAGVCSRREAERYIESGQVTLNGKRITSPAINVGSEDKIIVAGKALPQAQTTRLWLYHKPAGLVTSHKDPEGRPTVFDAVAKELPRVISVGRLDLNTEGLLLLTNDGALARHMELPSTGWKRCYRARIYGMPTPEQLSTLKSGIEVEGMHYGPIEVEFETGKSEGRNYWAVITLGEGKNREIRKVFDHIGCKVSRLIRISYGPFQLRKLGSGEIQEVPAKSLAEQLGKNWREVKKS